jgi:hypothetical protein
VPTFRQDRTRTLPVSAQLRVDANGIHDFDVDGRDLAIRGLGKRRHYRLRLQGVKGGAAQRIRTTEIEIRASSSSVPGVLAVARALLPAGRTADDRRRPGYAGQSLGGLQARLTRRDTGVEFSLESAASRINSCARAVRKCGPERQFTNTRNLAALLGDVRLPRNGPPNRCARRAFTWPADSQGDLTRMLAGRFDLETAGNMAITRCRPSRLADGQIQLANVGAGTRSGPVVPRQWSRPQCLANTTLVDYEQVSRPSAVPTPARARLASA